MYLQALNQKFPLVQLNADGSTQPISFQPPKNTNPNGAGASATPAVNPTTSNSQPPAQVEMGILRWNDPADHSKGCTAIGRYHRREHDEYSPLKLIAAGDMRTAWIPRQSGYAGPLVLQMATPRSRAASS
jgi:hypothetical protein